MLRPPEMTGLNYIQFSLYKCSWGESLFLPELYWRRCVMQPMLSCTLITRAYPEATHRGALVLLL